MPTLVYGSGEAPAPVREAGSVRRSEAGAGHQDIRSTGLRDETEGEGEDGNAEGSSGERVDVGDGGRPEGVERSPQRRAEFGRRPVVG